MSLSDSEKEKFQKIPELIWQKLNEKGKSLVELEQNKEILEEIREEEFWEQPIWHNKTDMDIFVAEKLNLDPDKWGKDKSINRFYKEVANGISQLRNDGKIVDWRHDSRTGIWRLNSHNIKNILEKTSVEKIWLWAVSPENYNTLRKKLVWASSNQDRIRKLVSQGDIVIFYISGLMKIKGIYEFSSQWYDANEPIWNNEVNSILYPSQIKIRLVKEGDIDVHKLISKLSVFQTNESSNPEKFTRLQSLILKPGGSGFPSNNANPMSQQDLEIILNELHIPDDSFFETLEKKGLTKTHIQVLEKFHILRREIIEDSTEIRGIRGESPIPPDVIVDEPHYMHNLVRGVFKPAGDNYALSIQTNPNSKWGVEIDFNAENWAINYDFEDSEKYASDIESLKKCFENDIPIGVIYKHEKGINEILGLGKIVNHQNTLFEIINFIPKDTTRLESKGEKYSKTRYEEGDFSCPSLETSTIRRVKQDLFRETLFQIYDNKCAFCGLSVHYYLIGAHIVPFNVMQKEDPQNSMNPSNGILLCRLCDVAFDKGHIILDEDYNIVGTDFLKNKLETDNVINTWISHIRDKLSIDPSSKFAPAIKYIQRKSELTKGPLEL